MKKVFRNTVLLLVVTLIIVANLSISAFASENLDEIENYTITVNVREDGTLDIKYEVDWLVLSDKNGSEPVTWVKIGIPNKHVEEINPITDNIKKAEYYREGGDFVRVDFTKKYYEGESFHFAFTIHQSYMYQLEDENIKYGFTAGWFEEIEVKRITILWNGKWVEESDATELSNDQKYLIWTQENLPEGEHFSTSVRYKKDTFATDENMQFEERSGSGIDEDILAILFIIGAILIIGGLVYIIVVWLDDGYTGGRGFGGGGFISSCASSSCACASCACACACAGGGRAGCSAKDFYDGRTAYNKDKDDGVQVSALIAVIKADIHKER